MIAANDFFTSRCQNLKNPLMTANIIIVACVLYKCLVLQGARNLRYEYTLQKKII